MRCCSESELRVSSYNQIDPSEDVQSEAANALNQIQILLSSSSKYRAVSQPFEPNYAIVVSWKNTVPTPAVFYQYQEVSCSSLFLRYMNAWEGGWEPSHFFNLWTWSDNKSILKYWILYWLALYNIQYLKFFILYICVIRMQVKSIRMQVYHVLYNDRLACELLW